MSQNILQNILTRVKNTPTLGLAIKDNLSELWVVPFTTFFDMKANGYDTVEIFLSSIKEKGHEDITVYLKRKNGNTSVYVKNQLVRLTAQSKSGRDSSTNQAAFSGNSENAPALANIPPQKAPVMHNNQPTGLLGGMNMQVMSMYSKADKYEEANAKLTAAAQLNDQLTETNRLQDKELDRKLYEVKDLEKENVSLKETHAREIASLKETHARELESANKPIVSDKAAETANTILPMIVGMVEKVTASKAGLNAPATPPVETFSVDKTQLLNFIKNDGITDKYCQLLTAVLNNAIADENVVNQLQELAQPKSE
jgi:hypothetical protein